MNPTPIINFVEKWVLPPEDEAEPMRKMDGSDLLHVIEDIDGIRWMPRPAGILDGEPVVTRCTHMENAGKLRAFVEANKHQIFIHSCIKCSCYMSELDNDEYDYAMSMTPAFPAHLRYAKKRGAQLISPTRPTTLL